MLSAGLSANPDFETQSLEKKFTLRPIIQYVKIGHLRSGVFIAAVRVNPAEKSQL